MLNIFPNPQKLVKYFKLCQSGEIGLNLVALFCDIGNLCVFNLCSKDFCFEYLLCQKLFSS